MLNGEHDEDLIFLGACILEAGKRAANQQSIASMDEAISDSSAMLKEVRATDWKNS